MEGRGTFLNEASMDAQYICTIVNVVQ
jgi:hypothetical protein